MPDVDSERLQRVNLASGALMSLLDREIKDALADGLDVAALCRAREHLSLARTTLTVHISKTPRTP